MLYYTYFAGLYRPGTFNRLTGGADQYLGGRPTAVPLPNGVDKGSQRYEAHAVHQALERGTRLAAQQRDRFSSRSSSNIACSSTSSAYKMDWGETWQTPHLQSAGVWQHERFGGDGPKLSDQGRRTAACLQADRQALTLTGNMSYKRFQAGHLPVYPVIGPRRRSRRIIRHRRVPASRQVRSGNTKRRGAERARRARARPPAFIAQAASSACALATTGRSTITRRFGQVGMTHTGEDEQTSRAAFTSG